MAIMNPFETLKYGLGSLAGAVGGAYQGLTGQTSSGSEWLRSVGGQLTGGARNYNQVPSQPVINQSVQSNLASPVAKSPSVLSMQTEDMSSEWAPDTTTSSTAPSSGGSVPSQSSGPTPEQQLSSELDSIFSPVFSALQGQENTLNANYSTIPGEITNQANTSIESVNQQKSAGLAEAGGQEQQAGTRKEDALSAATRLYNELKMGGQQRFGGASSAGEAFGALTAVEQQRRQGAIQGTYDTAMQQIGTYKQNLMDKAALAIQDINNQKDAALNQAARDFRDALQQIQSAKSQAESDKATASLNTLQDYRNKVYTINQQSLQFAQQLALNNQVSLKAVDDYTQKVAASLSGGNVAVTNFANQATLNPTTSYGVSSTGTPEQTLQTGSVTKGWKQDENGNWVYA